MGSPAVVQPVVEFIQIKEGRVEGPFREVLSSQRFVICLTDNVGCPKGAPCLSNADLRRRSPNKTTHVVFVNGLYEALRSLSHISNQSGLSPLLRIGERQQLEAVIDECRQRSRALLNIGLLTSKEVSRMERQFKQLVDGLDHGRNDHKVQAALKLKKSRTRRDRQGRHNPSATAMRVGSAIGDLLKRKDDIVRIMHWMDARTPAVVAEIENALQPFWNLRTFTESRSMATRPVGPRAVTENFVMLMDPSRRRGMQVLGERLEGFIASFEAIDVLPFSRDAKEIVAELRLMIELVEENKRIELQHRLRTLRQHLARVFAQRKLEDLIARVSVLLKEFDLRRLARARHYATATTVEQDRHFFEARFAQLSKDLIDFSRRMGKCSDDALSQSLQYKNNVQALIDFAIERAHFGQWSEAKKALKKASAYL
jgi:hypothetical protein